MNLALRPYMTAGVALVGAGLIAVTPVAAPPPEMQSHSIQLSAAIDDPSEVFSPVFTQAGTVIQNAIQAEIDDPFPIIVGQAGKLAADGKTLGDIANALGQSYAGLVAGLPGALTTYAQKLAAGDFTGAVGAFMPIAMGPLMTTFMQLMNLQSFVKTQFDVARDLTGAANIATATEVVSSPEATSTTETTPETKPLARDSLVAEPGKPGLKTVRSSQAHKIASSVSEQVSATANKIGEGIKSALGKPDKKPADASSGSSGDAK